MEIKALYLDMDGVIADFDAALRARGVANNETNFIHLPKDQWTAPQVELDRQVRECMEAPDFWNNIPLMEGARALWQYASGFNLYVLTATPRETAHRDRIEKQKRQWIQHYFPGFPDNRVIVCQRSEKQRYSGDGCVLIDDMEANCLEWGYHHGTAIRFKDAQQTIHQLVLLTTGLEKTNVVAFPPPELRDKDSKERKAEPIHSGVLMYFPDALAAVARISKTGNDKHNPGEPLHWARGKSMDQMDALTRHSLTRDKVDPETGELEAAALAWRALAELQQLEERRLCANGIRPYSGIVP